MIFCYQHSRIDSLKNIYALRYRQLLACMFFFTPILNVCLANSIFNVGLKLFKLTKNILIFTHVYQNDKEVGSPYDLQQQRKTNQIVSCKLLRMTKFKRENQKPGVHKNNERKTNIIYSNKQQPLLLSCRPLTCYRHTHDVVV